MENASTRTRPTSIVASKPLPAIKSLVVPLVVAGTASYTIVLTVLLLAGWLSQRAPVFPAGLVVGLAISTMGCSVLWRAVQQGNSRDGTAIAFGVPAATAIVTVAVLLMRAEHMAVAVAASIVVMAVEGGLWATRPVELFRFRPMPLRWALRNRRRSQLNQNAAREIAMPQPTVAREPGDGTLPVEPADRVEHHAPHAAAELSGNDGDFDAEEQEGLLPGMVQRMTRSVLESGTVVVHGQSLARFEAGQRLLRVHLAFCPPLPRQPALMAESLGESDVQVTCGAVFAYAARIDVRRSAGALDAEDVIIEWFAESEPTASPP